MGGNMVYRPSSYIYVKIVPTTIRLRLQEMEGNSDLVAGDNYSAYSSNSNYNRGSD